MRPVPLFVLACISLALAVAIVVVARTRASSGPWALGTYWAILVDDELSVYRGYPEDNSLSGSTLIFEYPADVLALPLVIPCALWVIVASRRWRRGRVQGFPVTVGSDQ